MKNDKYWLPSWIILGYYIMGGIVIGIIMTKWGIV